MSRVILATGLDELDRALRERISSTYAVESVSFLQALTVIRIETGDVVILSDDISMSRIVDGTLVETVDYLRRQDVRVIYLGSARSKGDKVVHALISRGVYDLLLSDEMSLDDIVARLDSPATYADVAHWMTKPVVTERVQAERLRRPTLTWRNQSTEGEPVWTDVKADDTQGSTHFVGRLGNTQPEESRKVGPRIVTVTGLPGSGVSFIALHLALSYAKTQRVTLIEASQRPVYTKWLNGPAGDRGAQQLGAKKIPERRWMINDHLRILPAHPDERGPNLRTILPVLSELDTDVVIVDVALDDVRNLSEPVYVLVIPPDIVKAEHVRDIQTRLVMVNMAPSVLPVELEEYGRAWTGVPVASCAYVPEQALAVVTGRAVEGVEVKLEG